MQTMIMFTFRILVVVFLCLPGAAYSQDNALTNPGFTSDFTGWEQFEGRVAEWMAVDADENLESGSAVVNNAGITDEVFPVVLSQCIVVQGERQIEYGGEIMVPEMQPQVPRDISFFNHFPTPPARILLKLFRAS